MAIDLLENPVCESEGGTDRKSRGQIKNGKTKIERVIWKYGS